METIITFILLFVSTFFMLYSFTYSFGKIYEIKHTFKKNIAIYLIFTLLFLLNNYYSIMSLKIVISTFLSFMLELIIFKKNIKETMFIVIILTFISIILEFVLSPLAAFFISNIQTLNGNTIVKILYSIINSICLILIIKNKTITKYINKLKDIINNYINFYSLCILLICLLNIIMYMFSYDFRNLRLFIVIIISICILIICLKVIINDKHNNKLLTEKNKTLKDEQKAYAATIQECRELKHNLKNELYAIKTILPKEQQNIINELIIKYNNNYKWINILNEIPEGLQGLVFLKINEAKRKNIEIYLNTKSSLKTSKNDYLDLSNIFGILIDNAIEASEKSKSKVIVINIEEIENNIKIEIINKFKNEINTILIGEKNYSTKEYKSGLGLNYIKKLNKPNIKVKFNIINDLFKTKIDYLYKK